MFLLPWVMMYALSSLVFSHLNAVRQWDGRGIPAWTTQWERKYEISVPAGADLRDVGRRALEAHGLGGPFFALQPRPDTLNILLVHFRNRTRLVYHVDQHRVELQTMEPRWHQILLGFHLRAGYGHDHFLSDVWAFTLDLVCLGFLLWIASGLYMWWPLRGCRLWGVIALSGGMISFIFFLIAL
jgi:hypothetical protein